MTIEASTETALPGTAQEMARIAAERAEERVMADLVNATLAEGFLDRAGLERLPLGEWEPRERPLKDIRSRMLAAIPDGTARPSAYLCRWTVEPSSGRAVLFPAAAAAIQPYRYLPFGGVYEVSPEEPCRTAKLRPDEWMRIVLDRGGDGSGRRGDGAERFLEQLLLSVRQLAWSLERAQGEEAERELLRLAPDECFRAAERRSSLRDRPFHPTAKAKAGIDREDYERYMGEFARDISLKWVAVSRRVVIRGDGVADGGPEPAQLLLSEAEARRVADEMTARGLADDYIALPAHPWQLERMLPVHLASEFERAVCVPLATEAGAYRPTSSIRSLAPVDGPHHVKLPLATHSLGASRYLPAVKLMNGDRGEKLLREALKRDPELERRLFLCDESRWWAYMPENGSLFDDPPRHLAAMVRTYPEALTRDPAVRLIPMAALGSALRPEEHFFSEWMDFRGLPVSPASAADLFGEVCFAFLNTALRLYRLGLMPEIHGQNAVLVWKDGRIEGVCLRDHDSVRVHLPWLDEQGIADPGYLIRPGYSNTLYNETPKDLLFYLQTLGIQVNLYAILETVAGRFKLEEATLWAALRDSLERAIAAVPFRDETRAELRFRLFDSPEWPLKLIVKPLLEQAGVPGAMPSGKGKTQNPFLAQ